MRKIAAIILIFFLMRQIAWCETKYQKNYEPNVEDEIVKALNIEPIYVSLDECLKIALANNFIYKSAIQDFSQRKWEFGYSLSHLLPEIALTNFITYYKGQLLVGGAVLDDLQETAIFAGAKISHDLTKGGWSIFEILSKKNLKKAGCNILAISKEDLIKNTAIAYYNLLNAKIDIENFLIDLNERRYQFEIAQARYEVGDGEKFDVLRTKIEVRQGEVELVNVLSEFQILQAKLSNLMGVEVHSPIVPAEKIIKEYTLMEGGGSIDEICDFAISTSSSIQALKDEIASLKNQKNQYYSEIIPKIDVYAQYSYQGTKRNGVAPNTQLGVNVNIPFGDNLFVGTFAKIKAMEAQIKSKQYLMEQAKRDLRENIIEAYTNSRKSLKKIELIREEYEMSEVSTEIATGKYFEGEGILLDVIQIQNKKLLIKTALSKAKIDYNIHQIEYLYYARALNLDNILKDYSP